MRRVRSADPEMARVPSGVTATLCTASACFDVKAMASPVARSQTRRVPSIIPETARSLSVAATLHAVGLAW
jgi:hypothetical protein